MKSQRYQSPAFEKLLQSTVINYGNYGNNGLNKITTGGELSIGFLIITHDNFYDKIQPFVSWMTRKKYKTAIKKLSELSDQTNTGIRDFIRYAYNNWSPPPSYVLLAGDTVYLPSFTGNESGSATDLYYSTMDDSDYLPDIGVGRFSVVNTLQTEIMTEKSINYETFNLSSGNAWIKKAAFLAGNDNYQISEGTHNFVISTYMNPNSYTSDKLYEVSYGATTADVSAALNDGRSIVTFSGHGGKTLWSDAPISTNLMLGH